MSRAYSLARQRGALGLTPRAETYLRGMCRGETRREIAAREFVSWETVRNVLHAAYKELGVTCHPGGSCAVEACYRLGRWDEAKT